MFDFIPSPIIAPPETSEYFLLFNSIYIFYRLGIVLEFSKIFQKGTLITVENFDLLNSIE